MQLQNVRLSGAASPVARPIAVRSLALTLMVCCGCNTDSGADTGADSSASLADGGSGAIFGGSSEDSGGSLAPPDGGAANPGDATTGNDDGSAKDASPRHDSGDVAPPLSGRQVMIWLPTYLGSFSVNLTAVTSSSPKAFTQVSPDFYNLNYDYSSGAAQIAGESFDGLSVAQVAAQVHAAGMQLIPLVYAGAGNSGTDHGIQNVISDSPAGAQKSFITSMVAEAQTRHYDGWNLDFEVGNTGYAQYGALYVSFLGAFKAALHAENMILTVDLGDWYIRECGDDGLVDLSQIGPSVDLAIIEDYSGTYGSPLATCPAGAPPAMQSCANEFGALMNVMCDVSPASAVSIGLIEGSGGSGANPFLDQALNAVLTSGFTSVAVWPDETPFLNGANIPNGGTWYSLLATYLAGH